MRITGFAVLLTCFTIVGCGANVETGNTSSGTTTATDETPNSQTWEEQLQTTSWEETEALIASHKGKVVVVDVWADW